MLRKISLLLVFTYIGFGFILGQVTRKSTLKDQIFLQIQQSCEKGMTVLKKVEQLSANNEIISSQKKNIQFSVIKSREEANGTLWNEVKPLINYTYLDTRIKDNFIVTSYTHPSGFDAKVKPELEAETELKLQKIRYAGKNIVFMSSKVINENLLYRTEQTIEANFDRTGKYQNHELFYKVQIKWLDKVFITKITCQKI